MSRTIRNRLSRLAILASVTTTVYAGLQARWQTAELVGQREETVAAVDGLLESDTYGIAITNEHGVILKCSKALESLSGWPANALEGKQITDIIPELTHIPPVSHDDLDEISALAVKNPMSRARVTILDCELPRKSGGQLEVRIGVRIVRSRNGHTYTIAQIDPVSQVIELAEVTSNRM